MIVLKLDEVMARRGMSLGDLADRVGITNVNMSRIKTGKVKAIRFSTLDAICRVVMHEKLKGLPFNLETPNELQGYAAEITMIREKTGEIL